jgi:hypothetical protein
MLSMWIGASLAGTPALDLAELMAVDPYQWGGVCAPAGDLFDLVVLGGQVLEALGEIWEPAEYAELRAWLGPESTRGLDRGGTLAGAGLIGGEGALSLNIPFTGNNADMSLLVTDLLSDELRLVEGVYVTDQDIPVVLSEGMIRIERRGDGSPRFPVHLLDGLGGSIGCVLALVSTEIRVPQMRQVTAVSAFLPLDSEELLRVRMQMPSVPAGASELNPTPTSFRGCSTRRPNMVALVATDGLEALPVLQELVPELVPGFLSDGQSWDLSAFIGGLGQQVSVPAGLTMAFFGEGAGRTSVTVIPITNSKGKPIKRRKLMGQVSGALGGFKGEWEQLGNDGFHLRPLNGDPSWIRVSNSQVVIGDNQPGVEEAHAGTGDAWGGVEAAKLSAEWPLVWVPGVLPGQSETIPIAVGVRVRHDYVEFGVDSVDGRSNDYLLGIVVGMYLPVLANARRQGRRSELELGLSAVVTAEIGHQAVHQSFVAVPLAPRSVDELSPDKVPWVSEPPWNTLGYAPQDEQRGTYSVTLTETGFVAHGWMDADGDGEPAHMIATWTPETGAVIERLTPGNVY